MIATTSRTKGHAVMEALHAVEYAELHEKLWSHIDTLISLAQIAAGLMALAGVAMPKGWEWLTPTAGISLAILSAIQIGFKPRERSIQFRDTRREVDGLVAKSGDISHAELERALSQALSVAPRGIEALTTPAQNRILARHGHPTDPQTGWQSFLVWCAA